MSKSTPNRAPVHNAGEEPRIPPQGPGSASQAHPLDAIPLPAHGFDTLELTQLASVPAREVIARCAALLMGACADKLGLGGEEPDLELDDARALIDALAALLATARGGLGEAGAPLLDGLRTLQTAFREASARPDLPGEGPGEQYLP